MTTRLRSVKSVTYDDGGTQKTVAPTVYDKVGGRIPEINANGAQVNTSYDAMERVISRTNPFPAEGLLAGLPAMPATRLGE